MPEITPLLKISYFFSVLCFPGRLLVTLVLTSSSCISATQATVAALIVSYFLYHLTKSRFAFDFCTGCNFTCWICTLSLSPSPPLPLSEQISADPFRVCKIPTIFVVGSEGQLSSVDYMEVSEWVSGAPVYYDAVSLFHLLFLFVGINLLSLVSNYAMFLLHLPGSHNLPLHS